MNAPDDPTPLDRIGRRGAARNDTQLALSPKSSALVIHTREPNACVPRYIIHTRIVPNRGWAEGGLPSAAAPALMPSAALFGQTSNVIMNRFYYS